MSRGEEVEAYSKILKYQKKRYGVSPRDIVIFIIGLINIVGGSFWLASVSTPNFSTLQFIIGALYLIVFVIAFFDYTLGFGLFNEYQIVSSSVILLFSVILSTIVAVGADIIFIADVNEDIIGLAESGILIIGAIFIAYFIITATPTRQGRQEMINKLEEIRDEIEETPLSKLNSKSAVQRAIKWLQFQQRDDGIWGSEKPLYETAEVLRTFLRLDKGLNYSWKRIIDGQEEIRTVEQTYFLVMEALDTASVEPNYEMLVPVLAISEVDPSFVNLDQDVFVDFRDELNTESEWEFVKELENFTEGSTLMKEIPTIFPMSQIFYHTDQFDVAQKCADIFSSTFDILVRRSQTRFDKQESKDISNLLLGKMYNSLALMIRGYKGVDASSVFDEFGFEDETSMVEEEEDDFGEFSLPDIPDEDIDEANEPGMPTMPTEASSDVPSYDTEMPQMPNSDFDVSNTEEEDFDLPSADMAFPDEEAGKRESKINVEMSMAVIRNYLRSKQLIDGSWAGNLEDTAECLRAVLDQESAESEFVKLGVHYLVALQEKNGSWQNDVVLTAKIIRSLIRVNKSMGFGGF